MSADNGVYILKTRKPPIKSGNSYVRQNGYEFRVAHCQAIDNIDYSDLYLPIFFGNSEILYDERSAWEVAKRLANSIKTSYPLEYGIQSIKYDKVFPNITARAAAVALDCYEGAKPLDL